MKHSVPPLEAPTPDSWASHLRNLLYVEIMEHASPEAIRQRVEDWKRADAVLRAIRDENIRNADTETFIRSSNQLFRKAIRDRPPSPTTGLVEQQRWLAKIRAHAGPH